MRAWKIEVYGRVQGVNFRNNVKSYCDENDIKGEVMNKDDGSVMIYAQGKEEKIQKLIEWIKENPGFSRVEKIDKGKLKEKRNFEDFRIIRKYSYFKDKEKALGSLIQNL